MSTSISASDIAEITLDFGEREIYNDIRSECDVTEILTVRPDATPELFLTFKASAWAEPVYANSTTYITATADSDHSEIIWLDIVDYAFSPETQFGWSQSECEALDGEYRVIGSGPPMCLLPQSVVKSDISWRITSRGTNTCTIKVTNDSTYDVRGVWYVSYMALTPATRYLKLRSTDDTSIAKYGRRVMDLRWYVGQTPNQMQSIIDGYRDKHAEPVPFANVVLLGETDSLVSKILSLKIDNMVALELPQANICRYFIFNEDKFDEAYLAPDGTVFNNEFWVNSVSINHDVNGVLEGIFDLEGVRELEKIPYCKFDESKFDEAYLGP
jgi:hypothetical protein